MAPGIRGEAGPSRALPSPGAAGLANHWPLMVLATPGLALALLPAWRDVLPRLPRLLGLALASVALPYAWMVWLSQQAPLISFYGSIDSWNDFWFFVSRQGYVDADVSPSAGWSDRWSYLAWFARDLVRQSTPPGFALALLGLGTLLRGGGRAAVGAGGSFVALLGNSLVLIPAAGGSTSDEFQVAIFRPYPLICYGVSALWLAAGMQWLLGRMQAAAAARWPDGAPRASRAPWSAQGPAALTGLAGAAMVFASATAGWPANDRSESDFAGRYAEVVFDTLPPNAVLLVNDDITIPLGYYHHVEERRPDVTLYHLQALAYANRLYDPFLPPEEKTTVLDRVVGSAERPVFALRDWDFYPGQRAYRHFGFVVEMLEGSPNTIELPRNPRGEHYFVDLLDRRPVDRWERLVRYQLLSRYGYYLGLIALSGSPLLLEPMAGGVPACGRVLRLPDRDGGSAAGRRHRRQREPRLRLAVAGGGAAPPGAQKGRPRPPSLRAGPPGRVCRRHRDRRRPLPAVARHPSASWEPGPGRPAPPRVRALTSADTGARVPHLSRNPSVAMVGTAAATAMTSPHHLARAILGLVDVPTPSRNFRMHPSIDRIFRVTRSR